MICFVHCPRVILLICFIISCHSWNLPSKLSNTILNYHNNNISIKKSIQNIKLTTSSIALICGFTMSSFSLPVNAVSGGGKDYATKDLRGESFESKSEINKDFTQCIAQSVNFKKAILKGSRFYRANLDKADFTAVDLSNASIEDAGLQGTIFTDAILRGTYISASFLGASNIQNVDFTDALMPELVTRDLCTRVDAVGVNPKTGVDTRESLMCQ